MSRERELELYGFTFLSGCCHSKLSHKKSKYSKKCKKACYDTFISFISLAIVIATIVLTTAMMEDELRYGRCNKHIKIKRGVSIIPENMYVNCSIAETIEFPDSLVRIKNRAFYGSNIRKFKLPKSVQYIEYEAFSESKLEEINLDFVEEIGQYAFSDTNLREIGHLSPNLTEISNGVFINSLLTKLEIPNGVKTIGYSAVMNNKKIESLIISDSVINIDNYAFLGCSNLKTVTLSKNLQLIPWYAFKDCSNLEEIVIPSSVEQIRFNAFSGASRLGKITFQEGLKKIFARAFENTGLTQIEFPDTLETIDASAFEDCKELSSIKFGLNSKISTIYDSAFLYTAITEVIFPASIKKLGDHSFYSLRVAKFRGSKDSVNLDGSFRASCKIVWNYVDPELDDNS